jgi:hypothetical protein
MLYPLEASMTRTVAATSKPRTVKFVNVVAYTIFLERKTVEREKERDEMGEV